jgi:hypothetical protein
MFSITKLREKRKQRRAAEAEFILSALHPLLTFVAMRGIINIIIGVVFIIGGLTGSMSLRGTGSGGALAVVGGVLILVGLFRLARAIC